jgi:ZIP family zinc transporter
MKIVFLTALGVGGSTVLGALLGFIFKKTSEKVNNTISSFAAGVMLAAAVIGLILPSLDFGGRGAIIVTISGILIGAVCLNLIDKLTPCLHRFVGGDMADGQCAEVISRSLLFVIAIAIHNFPEGLAAGVSFGTGDNIQALTVAGGIALQNIPEGMIIIAPMLSSGISRGKTFAIALMTGVIEVVGTLIGYYAVTLSEMILPFALAFAGGTMLYVISDEMIPDTHSGDSDKAVTYALLGGFIMMLVFDYLLG